MKNWRIEGKLNIIKDNIGKSEKIVNDFDIYKARAFEPAPRNPESLRKKELIKNLQKIIREKMILQLQQTIKYSSITVKKWDELRRFAKWK